MSYYSKVETLVLMLIRRSLWREKEKVLPMPITLPKMRRRDQSDGGAAPEGAKLLMIGLAFDSGQKREGEGLSQCST